MKAWIGAVALSTLTLAIAGCGPTDTEQAIALVKADVAAEFKDPDSVNFRNIQTVSDWSTGGDITVCGEVNAKNGFGAYVGYEKFFGSAKRQGNNITLEHTSLQGPSQERGTWFYPYQCLKLSNSASN